MHVDMFLIYLISSTSWIGYASSLSLGWVAHIYNRKNGEAEVTARAQLNSLIHPATPPSPPPRALALPAQLMCTPALEHLPPRPRILCVCAHLHLIIRLHVHARTHCAREQRPSTHLGCAHPPAYFCTPLTTHLLPLSHGSPSSPSFGDTRLPQLVLGFPR